MPGVREGHLVELFVAAGLRRVEDSVVVSRVEYRELRRVVGAVYVRVGPAGAFVAGARPGAEQNGFARAAESSCRRRRSSS